MTLIWDKGSAGRRLSLLPPLDVPVAELPAGMSRETPLELPELAENDICRHYAALERRSFGVDDGFYPLGSCTMKHNPRLHEQMAALEGFEEIHPLQPDETAQGCLRVLYEAERRLREITGMDAACLQPAAGAHGELTALLLIKRYHEKRGGTARNTVLIPDSAHGTNPATAACAGYKVKTVTSAANGCVDLDALRKAADGQTAALMLTNPNTLGIFEGEVLEITRIVHEAGGLCFYDGANLNAVMGAGRPGDMGFDCLHLNLHKTFSAPHGGGGPGAGAVCCTEALAPFLPSAAVDYKDGQYRRTPRDGDSIGEMGSFYGNFAVIIKALCYMITLGHKGLAAASADAVLNANYLKKRLSRRYAMSHEGLCMHEFVMTMAAETKQGVRAMDIAKAIMDEGIHPPTVYFPLIVPEALMVEPTETESLATLNEAADAFLRVYDELTAHPETVGEYPKKTVIGRPDEVKAARLILEGFSPASPDPS